MKFVINDQIGVRKNYTNLPESARSEERKAKPRLMQERRSSEDDDAPKNTFKVSGSARENPTFEQAPEMSAPVEEEFDYAQGDEEPERGSWRQSRWSPVVFVLAIFLLGSVAYIATHSEQDAPLERIRVEGAHLLTDKEVITLAGIDRSQKFYDIDLKQIAARIDKHSLINAAYPRRETNPSTIVLSIVERQPAAIMRSASGETLLIDREGIMLRPKKLEGLRDAAKLIQVPLISGIDEKDSASYRWMTRFVLHLQQLDSGALQEAIGELRRTPTGGYVLYTLATQTPIFLGSPLDEPFTMSKERELASGTKIQSVALFEKQLLLLAKAWRKGLKHDIEAHPPLFVDARFAKQIIVKRQEALSRSIVAKQLAQDTTKLLASATTAEHKNAPQSITQSHGSGTTISTKSHQ